MFIMSHFTHFTFNRHRSFKCLFVILCPHILNRIVCSIESINLCLQTSETGYDSLCFSFEFDAKLTEEMTSYDAMQFVCVLLCSCCSHISFEWIDLSLDGPRCGVGRIGRNFDQDGDSSR